MNSAVFFSVLAKDLLTAIDSATKLQPTDVFALPIRFNFISW